VFVILCISLAIFGVSGRITELQKEIDFIANHDIEVQNLASKPMQIDQLFSLMRVWLTR
jgi:two-component system chemotaxis sensor kinase CheA